MGLYGVHYLFGQFGLAVPGMTSLNILPISSLSGYAERGRALRESLDVVQALLSSKQNTGALSTSL